MSQHVEEINKNESDFEIDEKHPIWISTAKSFAANESSFSRPIFDSKNHKSDFFRVR